MACSEVLNEEEAEQARGEQRRWRAPKIEKRARILALAAARLSADDGQTMKRVATICVFLAFAVGVCAQSDEQPIRVTGVLRAEVFPGRPNYESVERGDEPEKAWIATVSEDGRTEELQLIVDDEFDARFGILRSSIGKKITVDGFVWEASTGHHHTARLITVRSIETEPIQRVEATEFARPASSGSSAVSGRFPLGASL